jgi:hypothetical protein
MRPAHIDTEHRAALNVIGYFQTEKLPEIRETN